MSRLSIKSRVHLAQQINRKDPGGLINKVDTATSDRFPSCSSLLLNGKVIYSKVKVKLGHMKSPVRSLSSTKANCSK